MDANEAVAYVAYQVNEVIAIYPITPSSKSIGQPGKRFTCSPIQCRSSLKQRSIFGADQRNNNLLGEHF
jgi:hypothetical protein